jgi:hypothetical protein
MGVGGPVDKYLPNKQRYATTHQNFRDAMAVPASLPEFKGNVVAVLTENYWDRELLELRAREAQLKQKAKQLQAEKNLSRADLQAVQDRLWLEEFAEREREILQKGVSNAEYHYLGSGKIMAQIGKGFAEALATINQK